MTVIQLVCGKNGAIRSCKASGHAGFAAKGSDIVCAAVSVLLRTAVLMLQATPQVVVKVDASLRGNIYFSVEDNQCDAAVLYRLITIGDFLETGITSLCKEYPKYVEMRKQIEA